MLTVRKKNSRNHPPVLEVSGEAVLGSLGPLHEALLNAPTGGLRLRLELQRADYAFFQLLAAAAPRILSIEASGADPGPQLRRLGFPLFT